MAKKKTVKKSYRHIIQLLFAGLSNSFVTGFIAGKIYRGNLKYMCHPGLNCYSCPGAVLSCPIGSLQAVLGSRAFAFSTYVFGIILLFGAILGRAVCGFLCPFGYIQELLYKIPFPKKINNFKYDRKLRFIKYILLVVLVIALPMALKTQGDSSPTFCKYVCPAGALEAGVYHVTRDRLVNTAPVVAQNILPTGNMPVIQIAPGATAFSSPQMRIGFLFWWKISIMAFVLLLSIMMYRPFCKYLCPLGAIYGIMNPVSLYRLNLNKNTCISCGRCKKSCLMGLDPVTELNHPECVRCGDCVSSCPTSALTIGFQLGIKKPETEEKIS
ncbi:MAG: 4Fe-4S binding protein [Eubacteriales bacterium]|nr:4Fe-4S binding protein [Eubacteriales bacterium]